MRWRIAVLAQKPPFFCGKTHIQHFFGNFGNLNEHLWTKFVWKRVGGKGKKNNYHALSKLKQFILKILHKKTNIPGENLTVGKFSRSKFRTIFMTHTIHVWYIYLPTFACFSWRNRVKCRYIYHTYCWWKKSCTTWDVWNPINNGIIIILGGAGFQPSTVWM